MEILPMKKKVVVTITPGWDPQGVRLALRNVVVGSELISEGNEIRTEMTEAEIAAFRAGKGAAHGIRVIEDEPAPPPQAEPEALTGIVENYVEEPLPEEAIPDLGACGSLLVDIAKQADAALDFLEEHKIKPTFRSFLELRLSGLLADLKNLNINESNKGFE